MINVCTLEMMIDTDNRYIPKSEGWYGENNRIEFSLSDVKLMQFTGLKDKNRREIYEGDILSFPDTESEYVDVGIGNVKVAEFPLNAFFPIEFNECEFGMTVEDTEHGIDGWISLRAFNEDYYKMSECEVIGNIYENPELLK